MDLYSRARKYIDIKRVKELREEKIKKRELAEIAQQQEIILAEMKKLEMLEDPKFCNWKRELEEGMNTSALGMINLNPEIGDLQSNSVGSSGAYSQSSNASFGGSTATFNFSGSAEVGNTFSRSAYFKPTNATQFDTFVTNVTVGSGPSQWFEPRDHGGSPTHNFPGGFRVVMYSKSKESDFSSYVSTELSSGTNTITIPSNLRVSDLVVYYIGWSNSDPLNGGATGSHTVSSATFQRRTPMNVFVSLDNPESLPFHRGGLGGSEERRKQLQDMLEAGNEWMAKNGLDPSKTSPGDIQIAAGGVPRGTGGKSAGDPENIQWPRDRPGGAQPGPGYRPPKADAGGTQLANAGPSTPVKTDSDGRIVPNQGGGRPGKVRLKPGMLPTA